MNRLQPEIRNGVSRRATMSDVARLAKVGKITVSRVLNDSPHVTERTRKRVFAAIKRLGYVPNEAARALRLRKSRCIGLIVPALLDHFFATCAHVIHETAQKHGYMVMTVSSNGDPAIEAAHIEAMQRRHIDGILLVPAGMGHCALSDPVLRQMPAVAFDQPISGGDRDFVIVENQNGARMAVDHLAEQHGHGRIAYLGPSGNLFTIRERLAGFRKAAHAHGVQTREYSCIDDLPGTIAVLKTMLESKGRPTALFTANNVCTKLVMEALQALKAGVPETFALIGFDDFEFAHLLHPPLTVVRQPFDEMARCATELLFERLGEDHPDPTPRRLKLPLQLIIRASCGCKRA